MEEEKKRSRKRGPISGHCDDEFVHTIENRSHAPAAEGRPKPQDGHASGFADLDMSRLRLGRWSFGWWLEHRSCAKILEEGLSERGVTDVSLVFPGDRTSLAFDTSKEAAHSTRIGVYRRTQRDLDQKAVGSSHSRHSDLTPPPDPSATA